MRKTVITHDEWLEALRIAENAGIDEIPEGEGWVNLDELGEKWNLEQTATRKRLKYLLEAGKMESKNFKVKFPIRIAYRAHYRLKR